ncbi:MAG: SDR family oxidoreductase [Alphaproteobacteria bacterium]|jgi:NAD(P)-dependent dehydrogenase (short-subunit alcohol dehydrogenase family)|nr:SDR family oxidoreductase [Alphaproteobacteria bacterium]
MGIMDGKVALVTGGGRGIGREVALSLASEGAKVVVADLGVSTEGDGEDKGPAEAVAAEIEAAGGEALASTDSVSDPDGAAAMVQAAVDGFGRIDAVVNIAGILRDAMFHKMTHEEWQAVIDVHLNGTFYVSHAAMPLMREQASGAFVHFTSTSGLNGNFGQANYAAAKMGIVGLSRVIALEGARYNIRSNIIAPFAWTRMIESIPVQSEEMAEAFRKFRERATPAHIAPMVTYLTSDAAAAVSGQVFGVRANEIYLMSQPRPIRTLHKSDGWRPSDLAEMLEPALRADLLPLDGTNEYYSWDPI